MNPLVRAVLRGVLKDLLTTPKGWLISGCTLALTGGVCFLVISPRQRGGVNPLASQSRTSRETGHPLDLKQKIAEDVWKLQLAKGQSLYQIQQSDKKPGPPLTIRADIRPGKRDDELSIGLEIKGQAGELYSGKVFKNGRPLPPPVLEIIDRNDTLLFSESLEYG